MTVSSICNKVNQAVFDAEPRTVVAIGITSGSAICAAAAAAIGFSGMATSFALIAATGVTALTANEASPKAHSIVDITTAQSDSSPEEIMINEMHICAEVGSKEISYPREGLNTPKPMGEVRASLNYPNTYTYESSGGMPYMQDRALAGRVQGTSTEFFGILDGHGPNGAEVAEFVKTQFLPALTNNLPSKTPSKSDIYEAFNKTYADLNASIDHLSSASGTTASIAIKVDNDLYVSNLGDSRTLLLKADGSFIQCTEDAKVSTGGLRPTLTRFGEKIKKIAEKGISFASRFFHPPVNRVLDPQRNRLKNVQGGMGIGMASVLGDIDCCPQALRKPKISGPYPLNSGDRLLSASDGVFDLLSSSQVNTLAKSLPSSQIPAHIAQISMNVAFLAYGQKADQVDNTSVLCTDLIPL